MNQLNGLDGLRLLAEAEEELSKWRPRAPMASGHGIRRYVLSQFGALPETEGEAISMRVWIGRVARDLVVSHKPFLDDDGVHEWVDDELISAWLERSDQLLLANTGTRGPLVNRIQWLLLAKRHQEAEETLERLKELVGAADADVLRIRGDLAWSYVSTTDGIHLAVKAARSLLTDQLDLVGTDHTASIEARTDLGYFLWAQGQATEEIMHREMVVVDSERVLGDDHPNTIIARSDLSWSYWSAARYEEAVTLRERVLADYEEILGPHHPETLNARGYLKLFRKATLPS